MVVYSDFRTGGVRRVDVESVTLRSSQGANDSVTTFTATVTNVGGRNSTTFAIGDEVTIFADLDITSPVTRLFTGILNDIQYKGQGQQEKITLQGRDYSGRMIDTTVEPVTYTNQTAEFIVRDIIDSYPEMGVTRNNVQNSGTTLNKLVIRHKSVYDTIKQVAEFVDFIFYVDDNRDLHFEPKNSISSGVTLNNTNVIHADFRSTDREISNRIWVYGGSQRLAIQDTFAGDGAGSVFTLRYRPHNTEVYVSGANGSTGPYSGGILELSALPPSGTQYLVDFDQRNIVFVSGPTASGLANNIPPNGSRVIINYDRDLPIIKYGSNRQSVNTYGPRDKIVVDNNINDPQLARQLVITTLDREAQPIRQGDLTIQSIVRLTAGNTIVVNLPNHAINTQTYTILECVYVFERDRELKNEVLKVKVAQKIPDIADTLKEILLQLRQIQARDIGLEQTYTRLEFGAGSAGARVKTWTVNRRNLGDSYILGHGVLGVIGDNIIGSRVAGVFIAGSANVS